MLTYLLFPSFILHLLKYLLMLLLVIFPSSHFTEITLKVTNDVVFLLTLKQGLQSFLYL